MSQPRPLTPEEQMENLRAIAGHLAETARTPALHERAARPEAQHRVSRALGGLGTLGLLLAFLLTKGKFLLAGLKFLPTLASGLLSVVVYAQAWGWPFAAGFVLLIFVHELGHFVVMKALGIPAGAPVFIPFMGAVIAMRGMPRNAWIEALVGIGGPLLGTLGAMALIPFAAGSPLLASLAVTGLGLNLFNLLPISPLDGGRIASAISRWLWVAGIAAAAFAFVATLAPILGLILVLAGVTLWQNYKRPIPGYHDIPLGKRLTMATAYFGLIAVIMVAIALVPAGRPEMAAIAAYGLASLLERRCRTGSI